VIISFLEHLPLFPANLAQAGDNKFPESTNAGMLSKSTSMTVCKKFRYSSSFKRLGKINRATIAPLKISDHTNVWSGQVIE
jgi:hypothetical protein